MHLPVTLLPDFSRGTGRPVSTITVPQRAMRSLVESGKANYFGNKLTHYVG